MSETLKHETRPAKGQRAVLVCVIAALVCGGLAYALMLPPWEGYDENAHYAYISQLADTGTIPNLLTDPFDASIERPRRRLPVSYRFEPDYDNVVNGVTYYEFFGDEYGDRRRQQGLEELWSKPPEPVHYRPHTGWANYIGQHPPVYYVLMGPIYKALRGQSMATRLLVLRLVSFALAAASLCFWIRGARLFADPTLRAGWLGAGVLASFAPGWVQDVGRIGNDSLAMLLASWAFYLAVAIQQRGLSWSRLVSLTLVLATGLWTKGFFLPMTAGVGLMLWAFPGRNRRRTMFGAAALMGFGAAALGAAWYVRNQMVYGQLTGSYLMVHFAKAEVLDGDALPALEFLGQWLWSVILFAVSYLWRGSFSAISLPRWLYLLWGPLLALSLAGFIAALRSKVSRSAALSGAAILLPVVLLFGLYLWTGVRLQSGHGGASGFYLHIFWLATGWAAAVGLCRLARRRTLAVRALVVASLVLVMAFWCYGDYIGLCTYAGLGGKLGDVSTLSALGPDVGYNLAEGVRRVSLLAWPRTAAVFWVLALAARMGALALWARHFLTPKPDAATEPPAS